MLFLIIKIKKSHPLFQFSCSCTNWQIRHAWFICYQHCHRCIACSLIIVLNVECHFGCHSTIDKFVPKWVFQIWTGCADCFPPLPSQLVWCNSGQRHCSHTCTCAMAQTSEDKAHTVLSVHKVYRVQIHMLNNVHRIFFRLWKLWNSFIAFWKINQSWKLCVPKY